MKPIDLPPEIVVPGVASFLALLPIISVLIVLHSVLLLPTVLIGASLFKIDQLIIRYQLKQLGIHGI